MIITIDKILQLIIQRYKYNWKTSAQYLDMRQENNVLNFDMAVKLLLSLGVICSFNEMLIYDKTVMKVFFAITLLLSLLISQSNKQCSKTASFLLNLVCLQIIMMGAVIRYKNSITLYFLKKCKQKEASINSGAIIFAIIVFCLAVSSGIGLLYSIYNNYHLQLIQKETLYMLIMVLLAFVVVAIADYLYTRCNRQNIKTSTRRKIFHFVPVGLLPVLVLINYKLFTLMAFGSFYLFWLLEVLRYFGKLTRKQDQQMIYSLKYKGSVINNFDNKIVHLAVRMVDILHQSNMKLSKLSFIQWMQSLNESRQPNFWFTHLSLILGLCVTYIQYPPSLSHKQVGIKQNISVILVVSDAMAAIIGRRYGKKQHLVPYSNNKTLEGYAGYVITALLLQLIVNNLLSMIGSIPITIDYPFVVLNSVLCGIGELFSADLDNIICGFIFIAFDLLYNSIIST